MVVRTQFEVDPSSIEVGPRLRPVDPKWVEALAGIIRVEGQMTAIDVCHTSTGEYRLVAGAHRLAAITLLGDRPIKINVVDDDDIECRQREISENLWHQALNPIDKAAFISELVTLAKLKMGVDPTVDGRAISSALAVQAKKGKASDEPNDTLVAWYGWSEEVGRQVGASGRVVERQLYLHKRLLPDVANQLRSFPISQSAAQLGRLAGLQPDQQRRVAQLIVDGRATAVAKAIAIDEGHTPPRKADKFNDMAFDALKRMSAAQRRDWFDELAADRRSLIPAGVSINVSAK